MIRRKFMKFAPKEHSDEKVKKTLEKHNVPMYEGAAPAKFGQFGNIAKDIASKSKKTFSTPEGGQVAPADKAFSWQQKAVYGPGGTGTAASQNSQNPYTMSQPEGNPYAANSPRVNYQQENTGNPYGSAASGGNPGGNPYGSSSESSPYGSTASSNPYGSSSSNGSNAYSSSSKDQKYANVYERQTSPRSPRSNTYEPGSQSGSQPHSEYGSQSHSEYGSQSGSQYGQPTGRYNQTAAQDNLPTGQYASGVQSPAGQSQPSQPYGAYSQDESPYAQPSYGQPASTYASDSYSKSPTKRRDSIQSFDELNQTHTELEKLPDEGDELMHSNASIYGGHTGTASSGASIRRSSTGSALDGPNAFNGSMPAGGALGPSGGLNGAPQEADEEEYDELNQMPSQYARNAPDGGPGYQSGQQLFEDSEDEDIENVKTEIRQVKQESLASTRRALQIAHEAETSGRNTLGMLGDQGERLGNTAKTVAIGNVQARVAEANADELQRLNRSIFIPNISNPFNSRRRNQMREQRLKSERAYDEMEQQSLERLQRESERRVADGLNGGYDGYSETAQRIRQRTNRDNPERKMYQFEADSEDDEMEDELAQNLEGISDASKRLHGLSLRINEEVTSQNERIEQMGGRVEDLDFHLHKSTAKMATIN